MTTLKLNKCLRKGCQLYAIHVEESKEGKDPELQDYPILQNFVDIFQEPPGIPPKRDIDFFYRLGVENSTFIESTL